MHNQASQKTSFPEGLIVHNVYIALQCKSFVHNTKFKYQKLISVVHILHTLIFLCLCSIIYYLKTDGNRRRVD